MVKTASLSTRKRPRLTTALINLQRPDEGMKIAEERLQLGEEEFVDSIIASFQQQMRALWKPGGFERGGNTKTQGIVRAEFIVHEDLPPALRNCWFWHWPCWFLPPAPVPSTSTSRSTSIG